MKKAIRLLFIATFILSSILLANSAGAKVIRLEEGELPAKLQVKEEELLEQNRKLEELLEDSGYLYHDSQLEAYVNEVGGRLVPANAESEQVKFHFYIIRDPTLNAFALPTGKIYLHSGLLTRLRNEAQLSFVLGHELSHVLNRDLFYFTESLHKKTIAAKVVNLALIPAQAFIGIYAGLANLGLGVIYSASVSGYGRANEARADKEALELLSKHNLNPQESIATFEIFLKEAEKYKKGQEVYFLSSHPSNKRRKKTLAELITTKYDYSADVAVNEHRYLKITDELRCDNAYLNIRLDRYQHAVDDLAEIIDRNSQNAKAHFYLAEAYRLMAEDPQLLKDELNRKTWKKFKDMDQEKQGWQEKALEHYQLAIKCGPDYPQPHRGLALFYSKEEDKEKAVFHFEEYLRLSPDAKDKRFIRSCLKRLNQP